MEKNIQKIILCGVLFLSGCSAHTGHIAGNETPEKIAVGTDLHVDPDTKDTGTVNPLTNYNLELVRAFLWDLQENGIGAVVLCGDLTNGGRTYQHEAVVEMLKEGEENGLQIFAMPGNHDIVDVSTEQFAKMYGDFGYKEAYDRDKDSLSYSVVLGDQMLVLIDTGGYGEHNRAFVTEETVDWVRKQIETAKEKGWKILPFGHYPILTEESGPYDGREELKTLFKEQDLPLYVCGHLHGRHMAEEEELNELVVEQTTGYPCSYVLLEGTEKGYRMETVEIDVERWASLHDNWDMNLLGFSTYEKKLYEEQLDQTVDILKKDLVFTDEELQQAKDFYRIFTEYRSNGLMYKYGEELKQHPGYAIIMKMGEGNVYGRWIPSVMENSIPFKTVFEHE